MVNDAESLGNLGMEGFLLILIIAFLVVGPKRLPDLAKALGRALAEFRRATEDLKKDLNVESILRGGETKSEEGVPGSESPPEPLGKAFAEIRRASEDLKKSLNIKNIIKVAGAMDINKAPVPEPPQKTANVPKEAAVEMKAEDMEKKDSHG